MWQFFFAMSTGETRGVAQWAKNGGNRTLL